MQHIILSRTDNLGDALFTTASAALLKKRYPACRISLLARGYVKSISDASPYFDNFIDWGSLATQKDADIVQFLQQENADAIVHILPNKRIAKLAKKARIPFRVGTTHRWFHFLTCNQGVRFTRCKNNAHEAQTNLQLLKPFGIEANYTTEQLAPYFKLELTEALKEDIHSQLDPQRFKLILHPGSNGRIWPVEYYRDLIKQLPQDTFQLFLTGSEKENRRFLEDIVKPCPEAINLIGKLSLEQMFALQKACDGLVAGSTGPLHTAAALGIHTLGLYSNQKTINHKRWGPLGEKAQVLVAEEVCEICETGGSYFDCQCLAEITPSQVKDILLGWLHK